MALCNLIYQYVKESEGLISQLFCWLYFVICTMINITNVASSNWLHLTMTGIVNQLLLLSFLFKRYHSISKSTSTQYVHRFFNVQHQQKIIHKNIIIFLRYNINFTFTVLNNNILKIITFRLFPLLDFLVRHPRRCFFVDHLCFSALCSC